MNIGSYDSKLLISLNEEEFNFLGRGRVDIEFLNGKGGYLKLIPGSKFSPYVLPKATKKTTARYSIFPPIPERFGSQTVLATKAGNALILAHPDTNKPVVLGTGQGRGRPSQAMVAEQMAMGKAASRSRRAHKAWETKRAKRHAMAALPETGLETLVESINAKKSATGDSMVFNVTPDGFLEVLVRFGR